MPKQISSKEEESSYQIKKDCIPKKLLLYNSKNFKFSENYSYLRHENFSNLDYLLSQGDIIKDHYLEYHKIYIPLSDKEEMKNIKNSRHLIEDIVNRQVYQNFLDTQMCKSCNDYLSFNLYGKDYESLRKLYEIKTPNNQISQKMNLIGMLFDNLYSNMQILNDNKKENKLKNYNTDYSILRLIELLKDDMSSLGDNDKELNNAYNNRIKVLEYVQSGRNVLMKFSQRAIQETAGYLNKDMRNMRERYVYG